MGAFAHDHVGKDFPSGLRPPVWNSLRQSLTFNFGDTGQPLETIRMDQGRLSDPLGWVVKEQVIHGRPGVCYSWEVRFAACEALVRLGAVDAEMVALLEELNRQPEAKEHNQIVRSVNDLEAQCGGTGGETAQTTQEVLEQARRAL